MTSSVVQEAPSLSYGWRVVSFADILTETRNGLYKHEDAYGRGTPILKMFNIGRLDGAWVLDRLDRVELSSDEKEDFALREGDILLNRVNSREWVGKCAVTTEAVAGAVFESKNMRLRFNRALAEPEFIALWLNGEVGRSQMDGLARQIAGMATVNKGDLATLRLPLPPLNEQRRIAARLKTQLAEVASARAAADAQRIALKSLSDALIIELFATANGRAWPREQLGSVCRLVNGNAYSDTDWSPTGVPIIRIQNLNNEAKPFNYWAGSLDNRVIVRDGDVLLAWSGTPGTSFGTHRWRRGLGVLNQHIFRVDLDTARLDSDWAVIAINEQLDLLIGQAHGAVGLRHVTKRECQELEIALPPLAEQQRVGSRLREQFAEIERARAAAEIQLKTIAALPGAYLREAFAPA